MRRLFIAFSTSLGICVIASFVIAVAAHIDGTSRLIYPLGALVVVPIPVMLVLLFFIMRRALSDEPSYDAATMVGPIAAEIAVAVAHVFLAEDRAAALTILADYGGEPGEAESTRVHHAIIHLSNGSLSSLRYYTDQAKQEYRDVLAWDTEMFMTNPH